MYIQVLGRSLPFPLPVSDDRHEFASRTALPADSPSPSEPSSLLPLLALTFVFVLVAFALARLFKHFNPSLSFGLRLPNYRWLRGKGQGSRGRLGLGGVELLPTSIKSIPTPSPSPRVGVFAGSSNVGKDSATSGLLSRSSSLDTLPQYPDTATLPPTVPFPVHARRVSNPFKFSIFRTPRNRGKSASHRRSRSLGVPIHHLTVPSSPLASVNGGSSAPTTPSPQALLIDFSSSSESASSEVSSSTTSSKETSSASSDLGTHRFSPGSDGPLIPIPIPTHHVESASTSHIWAFDLDIEDDHKVQSADSLVQAFKRPLGSSTSESVSQAPLIIYDTSSPPLPSTDLPVPTPSLLSSSLSHNSDLSRTPSTPDFPLTPPGLSTLAIMNGGKDIMTHTLDRDVFPSPISSEPEFTSSIPSHLSDSPDLQNSDANLVELDSETTLDHGIKFVNMYETEHLVDLCEESGSGKLAADEEVWTQTGPGCNTGDAGTTTLTPTILVSPVVQDVPLRDILNYSLAEYVVQSNASHEPITVNVEPPTPMPFVDLPIVNTATSPREIEVPMILSSTTPTPVSSSLREDEFAELVEVSTPHSGQISPVGMMEAWSWDDAWNSGIEHEIIDEVQSPEPSTAEVGSSFNQSHPISQLAAEDTDIVTEELDEEAWFIEEATVVWPDEEPVDIVAVVKEKIIQEVESVPRTYLSSLESFPTRVLEPDSSLCQKPRVHETPEVNNHNHNDDQEDESNESNDKPVETTTLESLSIPIITASCEEFPDPDLLPLPLPPQSISSTPKTEVPTLPEIRTYLSQTPTPPASPPVSPCRSLPVTAISSPNTTSPVTLPPSTASTPTSTRPAWSLRASDAPALGLPSASNLKQKSSPDLRSKNRLLSTVEEHISAPETSDSVITTDSPVVEDQKFSDTAVEVQVGSVDCMERTPEDTDELSKALPGSFPISQPPEPTPDTPAASAQSTALAPTTVPRRRTTRSPLDIALAMQLRPGLGLGADPAWMVRFLMSMFGWFAILLSGQAEFDVYRNGSYPVGH